MKVTAKRTTVADAMVCALAAEIVDGDVVGVGLGTPLAVAAALLARSTHAPDAHVFVGGAVDPRADLATCLRGPAALSGRTAGYVPHLDTMHMAESQAMTLQFLRPAQVDGHGNLNTSRIGPAAAPRVRLPGGLATADVPRLLPRLAIYLPRHERRSLPSEVDCVTGAAGGWNGDSHRARGPVLLVTDRAVIRFETGEARLVSVHPGVAAADVAEDTGFALHGIDDAVVTPGPTPEQRDALAAIDPERLRRRELG